MTDVFNNIILKIMLLEYITEWINEHPLLIEYVLNPCLGVLYSEAWDCLKQQYSNYKARRYQNALDK